MPRRSMRSILRALFVTGALLASGLTSVPASANPEPSSPPIQDDGEALQREAAAANLQSMIEAKGALGVYTDQITNEVVVVVPASGSSTFSATEAASLGFQVRVETRNTDRNTINRILGELSDRSWHPDASRQTFGAFFDPRLGMVVIEGEGLEEVFQAIKAAFPGQILYRQAKAERLSRQSDTVPHWGGAALTENANNTPDCTSGFTLKNTAGTRWMVTAGHCYALNTGVKSPGNNSTFGKVTNRAPFPQRDMELLGTGNYGTYVYVGNLVGTGTPTLGAGDPVLNFSGYCYSGQKTGEGCSQKVTNLNAQFCDEAGCTNNLAAFSGGPVAQGGDSGAPFLLHGSGGVWIRGMLIAKTGATMYAEKYSTISNQFGLTIAAS